jgi:hypothetical protein
MHRKRFDTLHNSLATSLFARNFCFRLGKVGQWSLDSNVLSINPETTGRPFCGFRMSSDVAGGRKKTICHPRFPVQLPWTLPVHVQVKNPSLRCSSIFG